MSSCRFSDGSRGLKKAGSALVEGGVGVAEELDVEDLRCNVLSFDISNSRCCRRKRSALVKGGVGIAEELDVDGGHAVVQRQAALHRLVLRERINWHVRPVVAQQRWHVALRHAEVNSEALMPSDDLMGCLIVAGHVRPIVAQQRQHVALLDGEDAVESTPRQDSAVWGHSSTELH